MLQRPRTPIDLGWPNFLLMFFFKNQNITNDILEIKVKENPQKIFQNLQQEKIYSEN